jgi:hypothetical protein
MHHSWIAPEGTAVVIEAMFLMIVLLCGFDVNSRLVDF